MPSVDNTDHSYLPFLSTHFVYYPQLRQTALVQLYVMLARRTGGLSTDLPMLLDTPDQIFTVVLSTGIEQQKQLNHLLHLCLLWIQVRLYFPCLFFIKPPTPASIPTWPHQSNRLVNRQNSANTLSKNTEGKQKPRNKISIQTRQMQKTEPTPIFIPNPDV